MYFILIYWGVTSCSDLDVRGLIASGSPDVESRFREAMYWNEHHEPIVLHVPSSEYCFYVCGDIHAQQTAELFYSFLEEAQKDKKSHFTIALGDFVTGKNAFPVIAETIKQFRETTLYPDTIFATVGNHDLMFGQWKNYNDCLGISSYFFEVETPEERDLFISLDSGNATLGFSQLKWLSQLLSSKREDYRHAILFTHTNLFKTGNASTSPGNLPDEEVYILTELCARHRVELFLQAHEHVRGEIRFKTTDYVVVDGLTAEVPHPSYCVITSGEKVQWEFKDCLSSVVRENRTSCRGQSKTSY